MAHFAIINEQNLVERVVVVSNEDITVNGLESEQKGIEILEPIFPNKKIRQTSYSGKLRKNYAGIGYTFNEDLDAFIPPKPFPSWVLDPKDCVYTAPVDYPKDGKKYVWFDAVKKWVAAE